MIIGGMHRNRIAHFGSTVVSIVALVIYGPILIEISNERGFWFLLPVWGCLIVGFVATTDWIEDRLGVKQSPSIEVHNSNFPKPSVRASGWDESLIASDSSVDAAFETAKWRRYGTIGLVDKDGSEVLLRWRNKGWRIELLPRGEAIRKLAVRANSSWAGREVKIANWRDTLLRRFPDEGFDDETTKAIVGSWLHSDEMPSDVAWATISYT